VLLAVLACVLLLGSAHPSSIALQTQAPPGSPTPSGLPTEDQKRIHELKLKAQDLTDLQKQLEIYRAILKIDPDDALANSKVETLQKELVEKSDNQREQRLDAEEETARRQRVTQALASGEAAVVEAKRTGRSEPLSRAREARDTARKYARAGDAGVDLLEREIDQETADQRTRHIEVWSFVGLLVAGAVALILLFVFRANRVLEMISGPQPGQMFPLKKASVSIGALAAEVDWAITDPHRKISRRHCDIVRSGRHFFIIDRSTNGTLLNGQPLRSGEAALLRRGDQIGLAGDVVIRFR
jgi:hypothetical protein